MNEATPDRDPAARSAAVDAFLESLPEDQRSALEHLRGVIRAAVPGAVELVSYGVPAFKYRGRPLVSFGATKDDCSFYVQSPAVVVAHRQQLAAWRTGKGTVHFRPDGPLPDELVRMIVAARMAETDTAAAKKRR